MTYNKKETLDFVTKHLKFFGERSNISRQIPRMIEEIDEFGFHFTRAYQGYKNLEWSTGLLDSLRATYTHSWPVRRMKYGGLEGMDRAQLLDAMSLFVPEYLDLAKMITRKQTITKWGRDIHFRDTHTDKITQKNPFTALHTQAYLAIEAQNRDKNFKYFIDLVDAQKDAPLVERNFVCIPFHLDVQRKQDLDYLIK